MPKYQKKENMDPIKDTPVIVAIAPISSQEDAVEIGASVKEDPAMAALRSKIEAEVRAKIAEENAKRVDPGFLKPGVRSAFQEAISQTQVHHGNVSLNSEQAQPQRTYEVATGTIRQDF